MADVRIIFKLDGVTGAQQGFRTVEQGATRLDTRLRAASQNLDRYGNRLNSIGRSLTLGLTAPLLLAGGAALKMAADATESENLFAVSMGDMEKSARDFSENLRSQLGLNAFEVRKQIGTFFQMTSSLGVSKEAAYELSTGLTQMTQDMASFFNLKPEEAFMKLQSGITGEIEPLKRLGIIVNETVVGQTALKHGLIQSGEQMSEAQKVMARFIAISEQTKNAQGDLARTIDSPTNQFRVLKSEIAQTTIEIGIRLLPMGLRLITWARDAANWIRDLFISFEMLNPSMQTNIVLLGGLAIAAGPAIRAFGSLLKVMGLMVGLLGLLTSPISLIALAIVGLAVGVSMLLPDMDKLGQVFKDIWTGATAAAKAVGDFFMSLPGVPALAGWVKGVDAMGKAVNEVRVVAVEPLPKGKSLFEDLTDRATQSFSDIKDEAQGFLQGIGLVSGSVIEGVDDTATAIGGSVGETMNALSENIKKAFEASTKASQKTVKQIAKDEKKLRDLSDQTFRFRVRIRERDENDLLQRLRSQLRDTERDAADRMRIHEEISDVIENNSREHITHFEREGRSLQQQRADLVQLRSEYAGFGRDAGGALKIIDDEMIKLDKQMNERTFGGGAKKAMFEYFDDIGNHGKNAATFVKGAFGSLEKSLSDFFLTGKFSFRDFTNSLKQGLADLAAKETINLFGALLGLGGGGGAGAAGGGGFLGGLLGGFGSSVGGAVGGFVKKIFGFEQGGLIPGQGTPGKDNQIIAAQSGEFVVNSRATSRNRGLLETLNAGGQGYAEGGFVSGIGSFFSGIGNAIGGFFGGTGFGTSGGTGTNSIAGVDAGVLADSINLGIGLGSDQASQMADSFIGAANAGYSQEKAASLIFDAFGSKTGTTAQRTAAGLLASGLPIPLLGLVVKAGNAIARANIRAGIFGGDSGTFMDINDGPQALSTSGAGLGLLLQGISGSIFEGAAKGPVNGMEAAFSKLKASGSSVAASARGFATGGDAIFQSPSMISVGENGPEHVSVRPLSSRGAGGSGVTLNFSGTTVMDEVSRGRFIREISRALTISGNRRGLRA